MSSFLRLCLVFFWSMKFTIWSKSCMRQLTIMRRSLGIEVQQTPMFLYVWCFDSVFLECFIFLYFLTQSPRLCWLQEPPTPPVSPPRFAPRFTGLMACVNVPGQALAPISRLMARVWGNSDNAIYKESWVLLIFWWFFHIFIDWALLFL